MYYTHTACTDAIYGRRREHDDTTQLQLLERAGVGARAFAVETLFGFATSAADVPFEQSVRAWGELLGALGVGPCHTRPRRWRHTAHVTHGPGLEPGWCHRGLSSLGGQRRCSAQATDALRLQNVLPKQHGPPGQ